MSRRALRHIAAAVALSVNFGCRAAQHSDAPHAASPKETIPVNAADVMIKLGGPFQQATGVHWLDSPESSHVAWRDVAGTLALSIPGMDAPIQADFATLFVNADHDRVTELNVRLRQETALLSEAARAAITQLAAWHLTPSQKAARTLDELSQYQQRPGGLPSQFTTWFKINDEASCFVRIMPGVESKGWCIIFELGTQHAGTAASAAPRNE